MKMTFGRMYVQGISTRRVAAITDAAERQAYAPRQSMKAEVAADIWRHLTKSHSEMDRMTPSP